MVGGEVGDGGAWRGAGGAGLVSAGCRKAGGNSASSSACGLPVAAADTSAALAVGGSAAAGGDAGADALVSTAAATPSPVIPQPPPLAAASADDETPPPWFVGRDSCVGLLWLWAALVPYGEERSATSPSAMPCCCSLDTGQCFDAYDKLKSAS